MSKGLIENQEMQRMENMKASLLPLEQEFRKAQWKKWVVLDKDVRGVTLGGMGKREVGSRE